MKKLFALYPIILISFFTIKPANAQTEAPNPPPTVLNKEVDLKQQVSIYAKVLDSLILEERYGDIIEIGERLKLDPEPEINQLPIPYLITAYYLIGNSTRSQELLDG